jgi:hypothetical protein
MATWRTVYCTSCRRERRHFTTAHGEVCSWCGNAISAEPDQGYEAASGVYKRLASSTSS